jgi:hypothetical protein
MDDVTEYDARVDGIGDYYVYLVFSKDLDERLLRIGRSNMAKPLERLRRENTLPITQVYAIWSNYEVENEVIEWVLSRRLRNYVLEGGSFRVDDELFDAIENFMCLLNEAQEPEEELREDGMSPLFPSITGEEDFTDPFPEELEEVLLHSNNFKICNCSEDGTIGSTVSVDDMRESILS